MTRISYPRIQLRRVVWRLQEQEVPPNFRREPIRSPETLYEGFSWVFADLPYEQMVVFVLNASNVVQAVDFITVGILNSSLAHPREVFRAAVQNLGASVIVAHNHPSGTLEPSNDDIHITKQLADAGRILGIPLHDHVIFTDSGYTSLAERGII